jgi:hypothetical protein
MVIAHAIYYTTCVRAYVNAGAMQVDNMAVFDGQDDILRIPLPSWCSSVTKMSVLWIDAWIYPSSKVCMYTVKSRAFPTSHFDALRAYLFITSSCMVSCMHVYTKVTSFRR